MNYLFSSCHQYMHCSVIRPRPEKKSVCYHFVPTVFLSKWPIIYATTSLLCDFHFSFPRHRFHPLESRYIALPCDNFFSYLKYGSASVEGDFYTIIFCFLLWRYPTPLFNTQVIWISVCLALRVSTAFLRLHPRKRLSGGSVSRPIHRLLRWVLKLILTTPRQLITF